MSSKMQCMRRHLSILPRLWTLERSGSKLSLHLQSLAMEGPLVIEGCLSSLGISDPEIFFSPACKEPLSHELPQHSKTANRHRYPCITSKLPHHFLLMIKNHVPQILISKFRTASSRESSKNQIIVKDPQKSQSDICQCLPIPPTPHDTGTHPHAVFPHYHYMSYSSPNHVLI